MTTEGHAAERRISGFDDGAQPAGTLRIPHDAAGQNCPQQNPMPVDALGQPLGVREAAQLIGCSAWTVRHRYLPQGLPHFRSGPAGKLVFYRNQVVRWILQQQRKGGR